MTYTTHGLMTPADMADIRDLYDLDAWKDEVTQEDEDQGEEHGWDEQGVSSYEL
jgi:hypothetical protein